jgi:hypothetical protein
LITRSIAIPACAPYCVIADSIRCLASSIFMGHPSIHHDPIRYPKVPSPHNSRRLLLQPPIRKSELIAVFFLRARIIQRALDLASAGATHLDGGQARRSVGQHTAGDCPRLSSIGTGTAADDGASPLGSARPSRLPSRWFRYEPS